MDVLDFHVIIGATDNLIDVTIAGVATVEVEIGETKDAHHGVTVEVVTAANVIVHGVIDAETIRVQG